MANIRVPPNVSSVTFVTSGVKAPVANVISGITAAEAADCCSDYSKGPGGNPVIYTNISNGQVDMTMPLSITSITINGQVKAAASGKITAVSGQDAANFIAGCRQRDAIFELVQG